jgi:hypothetical protein
VPISEERLKDLKEWVRDIESEGRLWREEHVKLHLSDTQRKATQQTTTILIFVGIAVSIVMQFVKG